MEDFQPQHAPDFEPDEVTVKAHEYRSPVPPALETAAGWAWRIIVLAILLIGVGWVTFKLSLLFIALMVALLIAVVLEPASAYLRKRWNWPPAAAAAAGVLGLVVIILGLLVGAGTGIVAGMSDLADQVIAGVSTIVDLLTDKFPTLQQTLNESWSKAQSALQNNAATLLGGVASIGSSVTGFLTGMILSLFSLFFFLKDGRRLWHWIVRATPRSQHDRVNEAGIRAWVTIGNYTRTQAIVAAVDAVGIGIVAMLLKTPISLAFPIAVVVFLFSFIPIVGAFLSGFLAVVIVLVNTQSVGFALLMLAGVILVQQIEGNVLQPVLQGNALNMHALAVVLIVAGGSALAGIIGALFAVPLAAAINTAILYLRGHDTYPYLNRMQDRPGGPPRAFEEVSAEHWERFDEKVAQHLTPKERKANAKQARAERRAARRSR
ncbi:hypothetical protein HMPREF3167_03965 [Trueperella sp. HMSC08B05]|uniref:AI-2E family transporter n=1 Tax=Trueperella TaxID=1069494 RepID=UPI0008A15CB5|nr:MULTISPECIES: AI-2E family transporter [Trueperella]OFS75315.1 hypothetical protein HMPREF3167_03965 [Trueperella sp. HMSC08B05]PKZ88645.1 AI-2E family transporter [Trueperella bernardiae]